MLDFHTNELKYRLYYIFLSYLLNVLLIWYFHVELIGYLMPVNLMFTSITEAFYVSLELSIVLGFIFTIPFFYCQLYEFIVPGLYEYEADNWLGYKSVLVIFGLLLIIFSQIFWGILYFFMQFESEYVSLALTLSHFMKFINETLLLVILLFTIPLLINYFRTWFIKNRKWNYFLLIIVLAFITPPDVLSLIISFLFLFILIELMVFFTGLNSSKINNV